MIAKIAENKYCPPVHYVLEAVESQIPLEEVILDNHECIVDPGTTLPV